MPDEQDRAEALDDDAEPMTAPDRPIGAAAYGAAGTEPPTPEGVAERAAREVPEATPENPNPSSEGGRQAGDGEIATERNHPVPAESAAMHIVDVPTDLADLPDPMGEPIGGERVEQQDLEDENVERFREDR